MTVRFDRHAKGYGLVVVDGEDTEDGRRRYVSEHRLAAVAWGVLEGLDDPREVHHRGELVEELTGVPCLTAEGGLEALEPEDHARLTREQEQERRGAFA